MSGYAYATIQSITCPLGLIDYENKIIGFGTAMYIHYIKPNYKSHAVTVKGNSDCTVAEVNFTVHIRSMC